MGVAGGLGECHACDLAHTPGCHHCRNTVTGAGQGVRDAMTTDLFRLVREDSLDVAVLVSSDLALITVVRFLIGRGTKVVHGAFPPLARDLSASCSGVIDLRALAAPVAGGTIRSSTATG